MKVNLKYSDYLWDDDEYKDDNSEGSESENTESERIEEFEDIDQIAKQTIKENGLSKDVDLDEALISAAHACPTRNITAEHLSKKWHIDIDTAKITLDSTSQLNTTHPDRNLTRSFTTNDRMLRYKRIKENFFMDTFFATRKMEKYLRRNRCCQIFVTDKGFVYVVTMKARNKYDILSALKQFTKEIDAPEAIICNGSGEQTAIEVNKYCGDIGTTLRILEEGTPLSKKS